MICDGEEVRRQLIERQRLSPRNVVTIYNGVDTALYGAHDRLAEAPKAGAVGLGDARQWWARWRAWSR